MKSDPKFDAFARALAMYKDDWAAFAQDVLAAGNDEWQEKILWSIQSNQKTCIAGATGVGKDYVAAQAAWAKLALSPFSKVVVTSASGDTLKTNFWGELAGFYRSNDVLQKFFEMGTREVKARGGVGNEWFLLARTCAAKYSAGGLGGKEAEGIAGVYAKGGTLTIVDEASGVDDAVFDAIEGSANAPDRKLMYIGNPLRKSGRFHDIFRHPNFTNGWTPFHIDYLMSGRTRTPEQTAIRENWIKMHGENSAYVQARVWGQFPTQGTIDTVMAEEDIIPAFSRYHYVDESLPLDIGVDCARFGDDRTVIVIRRGLCALWIEAMGKKDTIFITNRLRELIRKFHKLAPGEDFSDSHRRNTRLRVDEGGGYGAGVIDPFRRDGFKVAGVQNGAQAHGSKQKKRFDNLGTQLWFDLKDTMKMLNCGRIRKYSDILVLQLAARQYEYTAGREQKIRLVSKERMRRAGLGSPDEADAFVLAFADMSKLGFHDVRATIRLI